MSRIRIVTAIFLVSLVFVCAQVVAPLYAQQQPRLRQGQSNQQGQINSQRANGATATKSPQQAPFQLTPSQQAYVDQVLRAWEHKSSTIKTYQCHFTRWTYDPIFGPKDPNAAKTVSRGLIRYAAPDKGMFRVDQVHDYVPPQAAGEKPRYVIRKDKHAEHWVCDGKSIFEFKSEQKQLLQTKLPTEMQGKAIVDGPLPFLFGAKAKTLKKRYWIRGLPPPKKRPNEHWLEVFPKQRKDATNFQKVRVILDTDHFLPIAMQIYPPGFNARTNPGRESFQFSDRKVNDLVNQIQGFMKSFVDPNKPLGWEKVVADYEQQQLGPSNAEADKDAARQATVPGINGGRRSGQTR